MNNITTYFEKAKHVFAQNISHFIFFSSVSVFISYKSHFFIRRQKKKKNIPTQNEWFSTCF